MTFTSDDYYQTLKWASGKHIRVVRMRIAAKAARLLFKKLAKLPRD